MIGMPLAMAASGQELRLVGVQGGLQVRQRLGDLGLTPGTILRLVQAEAGAPVIIAFRDDSRLALGRGMAMKLMVGPVSAEVEGDAR